MMVGAIGAVVPKPDSAIMVGLVGALELIIIVPVRVPVALGAKMMFNTHEFPAAILIGEPVLGAPPAAEPNPHQCAGFGAGPPVVSGKMFELLAVMPLSVSAAVPLLVMVMACGALDPPTVVLGKVVVPLTVIAVAPAAVPLSANV